MHVYVYLYYKVIKKHKSLNKVVINNLFSFKKVYHLKILNFHIHTHYESKGQGTEMCLCMYCMCVYI